MSGESGHARDGAGAARKEVGGKESSSLHPPHVSSNDGDSQIQAETDSRKDIPVMPANASGSDKVSSTVQDQAIDPTSMYDRRPAEDKNQPPSDGT